MLRIRILALVGLALLAGCSAPEPGQTPHDLVDELRALPGILEVHPGADDDLTATVRATARDEVVLDTARTAHELATAADWPGAVVLVREAAPFDQEADLSSPIPWTLPVYPGEADVIAESLTTLLAVDAMPHVASVALGSDGWPTVVIDSLESFAATFRALDDMSAFADGGTYVFGGEQPRLSVVHLAERMSPETVEVVIRIAVEHPLAEVELQSLTSPGNRWPQLYVARLTPEEVLAVAARLRDPALADADLDGYPIPFFLSTIPGPDGPVETVGTFGDVPA